MGAVHRKWPVACARAGDSSVYVRQARTGPGRLIEITTKGAGEHDAFTVTLDGRILHTTIRRPGAPAQVVVPLRPRTRPATPAPPRSTTAGNYALSRALT
jgi:hypothetical protein